MRFIMATIDIFINQLKGSIPCNAHPRTKGISLTKYDEEDGRDMGLFAIVAVQKDRFKIKAKEWLADDLCRKIGKPEPWGHGKEKDGSILPGLIFFVRKGSRGQDY